MGMNDDFRPNPQYSRVPEKASGQNNASPAFRPPEEVARTEAHTPQHPSHGGTGALPNSDNPPTSKHGKQHWWKKLSKKQWIIIAAVATVLIGGGVASYFIWFHHPAKPVVKQAVKKPVVKPAPVQPTSTLTGLPISDASINKKQVTAVMIENSTAARPQSGLDKAGLVFEAIAEGGITRFTALYQDTSTDYLGPVRSVRPYYLSWLMGFDAAVAHVGGSGEALNDIKVWNVKNLDQSYNSSFFTRITGRVAPHNVYTSIANLNALETKLGYNSSSYTGFPRKKEVPSKAPTATSIDLAISSYDYHAHYDYDAASNSYKRSEGGKPHMVVDKSGAQVQLSPKVVIAMVVPRNLQADDLHNNYKTLGSGHVFIFQDGISAQGNWTKDSNTGQIKFTDADGQPFSLNPGQTWITAVEANNLVSYK